MKKALSIILAMAMMVSSLAASTTAFAETKSASVEYSVCDGGMFTLEPTELSVSADLSDKYDVGYNDTISQPSILDATIAAHIALFGDDFMEYAPLSLSSDGWFLAGFGEESSATSYRLNGAMDDGNGTWYNMNSPVADGDYVEFMFYQDTYGYSDAYTSFNTRNASVMGDSITLTLTAEGYDENWNTALVPASNVIVTVDGEEYGTTNENGEITINFDMLGEHIVSATGDFGYSAIFAPYCKVTLDNELTTYIKKEMKAAAKELYAGKEFTVNDAVDFYLFLNSGYDVPNDIKQSFVKSVKESLDKNGGVLLNASGNEDLGLYGATALAVRTLGYDWSNFYGYDIRLALESLEPSQISNPYLYFYAVLAAHYDYSVELCNQFINDYYTMGKGMNYWGYSCDNTAIFLTTISFCESDFPEIISDARTVLDSYQTEDGAFYNAEYGTEANSDSTALSLAGYSLCWDKGKAWDAYKNLVKNFEESTGKFTYGGEYSAYSTKDALIGLERYLNYVNISSFEHPEEITKTTTTKATASKNGAIKTACVICGKQESSKTIYAVKGATLSASAFVYNGKEIKPAVTVKDTKGNKLTANDYTVKYSSNKNVGTATVTITLKGNYSGTIKKTFKINPRSTSLSKLTATKKGFKVTWKKQATQTTGYQIRYSTKSDMTKAKTVTISKNSTTAKTISKLSGNKKYYVQIRTYKTVGNTKYYSGWSGKKAVTTKK